MTPKERHPVRVTIIGLGRVGTSLALALKATERPVFIVGHDKDPARTRRAARQKAIDKGEWNLPRSVENADLVILSIPLSEIAPTLRYIAQDLRPNAVVMDTAPLMQPVLAWAREILPANVHFVSSHPILRDVLSGPEHARADLFQGEIVALCPAVDSAGPAVQLVVDVVKAIGARPLFMDPAEHDSMVAAVEQLPRLVALALSAAVVGQPSWRDMERLAGGQFEAATYTATGSAEAIVAEMVANRQHVLHWLDVLESALSWWRESLSAGSEDTETLTKAIAPLLEARETWIRKALAQAWEQPERRVEGPSFADWLFGQGLARRWRQERREDT